MGYYAMIPLWSEQDNAVKKGQEHHSEKTAKQCDGKTPSLNLPKIYPDGILLSICPDPDRDGRIAVTQPTETNHDGSFAVTFERHHR